MKQKKNSIRDTCIFTSLIYSNYLVTFHREKKVFFQKHDESVQNLRVDFKLGLTIDFLSTKMNIPHTMQPMDFNQERHRNSVRTD